MSTRISSQSIFEQSVFQLLRQQSQINRTQLEVSSGRRIVTAKDDPIGAGVAEAVDRSLAELGRWQDNANLLQNRLQREEEVLRQVTLNLQRVSELSIQANSAIQTPESLQGMLKEVELIKEGLVQLANSTDGTGRYLFGGTSDGSPPFLPNAGGGFDYFGDQVQRRIEIGPELTVPDSDPGSEIFQRIRTGNGDIAVRMGTGNTGTGVLSSAGFTDQSAWTQLPYTVTFTDLVGPPPSTQWTVTDDAPPNAVIATGTYTPGAPIEFNGVQLAVTGDPASGDTFSVRPAPNRDVFDTVQSMIDAINLPNTTPADKAARQNAFYAVIEDLQTATNTIVDRRAAVGARHATVDRADTQRLSDDEILRGTLSDIRDTDYAEAISRLSFQLQSLEAAQQSFVRVQILSMFNLLR